MRLIKGNGNQYAALELSEIGESKDTRNALQRYANEVYTRCFYWVSVADGDITPKFLRDTLDDKLVEARERGL